MNDAIKGALLSKTMWLNWAVTAAGALDWASSHSILIGTLIPGSGPLLVILGAIGTILRAITTSSLAEKGAGTSDN